MSPNPAAARQAMAREYATALLEFLGGGGEAALTRAYQLGRRAASEGIGLLDLALMHYQSLADVSSGTSPEEARRQALAAQFLVESLSPFEMTLRAHQDNARMLGLSETLAARDSQIDRSREQLRAILDATTAIVYLKDSEGRYLFVNAQFQKVFGLRREEVIGRADHEVLPLTTADTLRAIDREVLDGRTPRELEETVTETDGPHTLLSLKLPLLDDSGEPYGLCCVATDITERKQRDAALRRAMEAAEAANRELESFSYSVAHDLRAPLRSIDGFGQALYEDFGDRLDAQGQQYLRYVRESAQHMAHLIDDLLALARVSRRDLEHAQVDLSATCRAIADRLQAAEPARRVEFCIQDQIVADGDARLLRGALESLLGNAWKFTGRRPLARIEFGVLPGTQPAIYFVRDSGAGFEMAYVDKLFGVFQRLHKASEFAGSGIGLATVQRIIRRHGGRVWAEGEVDQGATFYFTLEGVSDDGESDPAGRGQPEGPGTHVARSGQEPDPQPGNHRP